MVAPNKPSTEGTAGDDPWTRHCLERASSRALAWTVLAGAAFVAQFVLIFLMQTSSDVPAVLLAFSATVFLLGVWPRRSIERVLADQPWQYIEVRWERKWLVVLSTPSVHLVVRVANPLLRGRIGRHRRVWFVEPDAAGNTVVTFGGIPKLFRAGVFR